MLAHRLLITVILLFQASLSWAELTIPPVPAENGDGWFIHDFTGVIDSNAMERIGQAQKNAFEKTGIPIIVVAITSMKDHGYEGDDIHSFAQAWFNQWKIGSGSDGNHGILLLFSQVDRKVRIQLGNDWGHDWDSESERIVDRDMVPFFRNGEFGRGLSNGVESLMEMAIKRASVAPRPGTTGTHSPAITADIPRESPENITNAVLTGNQYPGDAVNSQQAQPATARTDDSTFINWFFGIPMALGVLMMIGGAVSKDKETRISLLKYGAYLALFPLAVFAFILYIVAKMPTTASNTSSTSSTSSQSTGGFFGGGFRGGSSGSNSDKGGGSSGSW